METINNILKYRISSGKKQQYIASILKMTQQNYSKIERGERKATTQQKRILAQEFGIPVELLEEENLVMISSGQKGGNAATIQSITETPESAFEGYKQYIKSLEERVKYLEEQNAQLLKALVEYKQ
jgi:transcriptional regulator with XRE-family HTH domain